jgi:hypothetical protein
MVMGYSGTVTHLLQSTSDPTPLDLEEIKM